MRSSSNLLRNSLNGRREGAVLTRIVSRAQCQAETRPMLCKLADWRKPEEFLGGLGYVTQLSNPFRSPALLRFIDVLLFHIWNSSKLHFTYYMCLKKCNDQYNSFSLFPNIGGKQTKNKNKKDGKRGGGNMGKPLSLQVPFRILRNKVEGLLKLHPSRQQNGDWGTMRCPKGALGHHTVPPPETGF